MIRLKHLVIDDFLPAADRAALLAFAFDNEVAFAPSDIRYEGSGSVDRDARDSLLCKAPLGGLKSRFRDAMLARQDELFAGTGTHPFAIAKCEIEMAAHRDGCFFTKHQDSFTGHEASLVKEDRLISMVYYFHAEPVGFTGGELAIFPVGDGEPELIEPRDNRLIAFPSMALHEVLPVSVSGDAFASARFSINCWLSRRRES